MISDLLIGKTDYLFHLQCIIIYFIYNASLLSAPTPCRDADVICFVLGILRKAQRSQTMFFSYVLVYKVRENESTLMCNSGLKFSYIYIYFSSTAPCT